MLQLGFGFSLVYTLLHTIRRTTLKAFFNNRNFRKSDHEFLKVTELSWCPGQKMERPVIPAQSTSRFLLQPLRICWFSHYQFCFCTWVIGARGWPCCCIKVIDNSKFSPLCYLGIESSLFHTYIVNYPPTARFWNCLSKIQLKFMEFDVWIYYRINSRVMTLDLLTHGYFVYGVSY